MSKVNFKNPVLLGVALTNRPHVRLRNYPIEVMEDGRVRVPMMVAGTYRHPYGELDFTPQVLEAFIKNMEKGVADNELGADTKHNPQLGHWLWFEKSLGGDLKIEEINGEKLLVGYGVPTRDEYRERLASKEFRFASIEFDPNYKSNKKQERLLSSDIYDDDNIIAMEDSKMDELQEQLKQAQAEAADAKAKLAEAESKLAEVNSSLSSKLAEKEAELAQKNAEIEALKQPENETPPTPRELELQARIMKLERDSVVQNVELTIAKAKTRTNENGQGIPAFVLNAVHRLMLGEPVMENGIKLEEADYYDASKVARHFRKGLEDMLMNMPIENPTIEAQSQPDDTVALENNEQNDMYAKGKAEAPSFWS